MLSFQDLRLQRLQDPGFRVAPAAEKQPVFFCQMIRGQGSGQCRSLVFEPFSEPDLLPAEIHGGENTFAFQPPLKAEDVFIFRQKLPAAARDQFLSLPP